MFTTIDEVKAFVGGSVNYSLSMDSLGPFLQAATERHLAPLVGHSFADAFYTDITVLPTLELQEKAKAVVAFLGVYEYSKVGQIEFSEGGMTRVETENRSTAYKYQVAAYQKQMLYTGYDKIEILLKALDSTDPLTIPDYEPIENIFIRYASDMSRHYHAQIPRYTFESLRVVALDVENWISTTFDCPDFYDKVIADTSRTDLTTAEFDILKHLKKAIANFTVREALRRNMVLLQGQQVVVIEKEGDDATSQVKSAMLDRIAPVAMQADTFGNRWLSGLQRILDTNLEAVGFELYKACVDAKLAAEAVAEECEPCKETKKKKKKIVRL